MNEDNTKVIFIYDDEVEFFELTPDQMKLLEYLMKYDYLIYDLNVKVNPEFEKI
jgi:hypothetical protein